jgi:hypothetical protein
MGMLGDDRFEAAHGAGNQFLWARVLTETTPAHVNVAAPMRVQVGEARAFTVGRPCGGVLEVSKGLSAPWGWGQCCRAISRRTNVATP